MAGLPKWWDGSHCRPLRACRISKVTSYTLSSHTVYTEVCTPLSAKVVDSGRFLAVESDCLAGSPSPAELPIRRFQTIAAEAQSRLRGFAL